MNEYSKKITEIKKRNNEDIHLLKYEKAKKTFKKHLILESIIIPLVILFWCLYEHYYSGNNYYINFWGIIVVVLGLIIVIPIRAWYFSKDDFEEADKENEKNFNDIINSLRNDKNFTEKSNNKY